MSSVKPTKALRVVAYLEKGGSDFFKMPASTMIDISRYISSLTFDARVDAFPTSKIDLVSGPGKASFSESGDLVLGTTTVNRADVIHLYEIDDTEHKAAMSGKEVTPHTILLRGVVTDVMYSIVNGSESVSVVVESHLIGLDTSLVQEVLNTRSVAVEDPVVVSPQGPATEPAVVDGINLNPIVSTDMHGEASTTLEGVLRKDYFHGLDGAPLVADGVPIVYEKTVGSSKYYVIRPWYLIRDILNSALQLSVDTLASRNPAVENNKKGVQKKIEHIKTLMSTIVDDGLEVYMTSMEYESWIKTYVIPLMVSQSNRSVSIWGLITKLLLDFHIHFSPNVLFSPEVVGVSGNGSFALMNPYNFSGLTLNSSLVTSFKSKVPSYKHINTTVGFDFASLTSGMLAGYKLSTEVSESMHYPFRPTDTTDWVIGKGTVEYASDVHGAHKLIRFPGWVDDSIVTKNRRDQGRDAIADLEIDTKMDDAFNLAGQYLRTAWMIAGRAMVTAATRLVYTLPDLMRPMSVIRVSLDGGDSGVHCVQDVTGMVSSVAVTWDMTGSYGVSFGLTHVTPVYDKYFRAIKGGLGPTPRDVLRDVMPPDPELPAPGVFTDGPSAV